MTSKGGNDECCEVLRAIIQKHHAGELLHARRTLASSVGPPLDLVRQGPVMTGMCDRAIPSVRHLV